MPRSLSSGSWILGRRLFRQKPQARRVSSLVTPRVYVLSHVMESKTDGSLEVCDTPQIAPDEPSECSKGQQSATEHLEHNPEEVEDEPRPPQPSPAARDLPPEILSIIFRFYLWAHASCLPSPSPTPHGNPYYYSPNPSSTDLPNITATSPKCTSTGFPILPLPSICQPLTLLSSVCALWRHTIHSTPALYAHIAIRFDPRPLRPISPRRPWISPIRRTVNLLRLMLHHSAPELLNIVVMADTYLADLCLGGDGRMGLARLAAECTKARERWGELTLLALDDKSLFYLLFWGAGVVDEGAWYRRYTCDLAGPVPFDDDLPLAVNATVRPQLKPAPRMRTLSLRIGEVWPALTRTGQAPYTAAQLREAVRRKDVLVLQDLEDFIHAMPAAYPSLVDFELHVAVLPRGGVEAILLAVGRLFIDTLVPGSGDESDVDLDSRNDGSPVQRNVSTAASSFVRYEEWMKNFLANDYVPFRGYMGGLELALALQRHDRGGIELVRVSGKPTSTPLRGLVS